MRKMHRWLLVLAFAGCQKTAVAPSRAAPTGLAVTETSRAASLVARLVQAKGGFWNVAKDPVIAALLALGDEAVPPLIDAVEHDERLTHIEFERDHELEDVSYAPVYRVAYWVLERLIATSYFASQKPEFAIIRGAEGRAGVAAELRAEWRRVGALSREERWYRTLAD